MSEVEKAIGCFGEGLSCSQAVLSTYAERYGLSRDLALKLADAFGGGMGGLGKTCGAVTGAMMVIGLCHGRTVVDDDAAKLATKRRVQQLVAKFEARHGTVACRDLIGCEIDTPAKVRSAHARGVFDRVCVGLIRSAAEILEELLSSPSAKGA